MNTLRMPAAQTLLLFSHAIDTNKSFSRIVCDSWLNIEFPYPESGQILLMKATNLRSIWNNLLEIKLSGLVDGIESNTTKRDKEKSIERMEYELWENLANFMNTEVPYTLKRLLPADLKSLYVGPDENNEVILPNPFLENFVSIPNAIKGGVYLTENITFGCLVESDWTLKIIAEIMSQEYDCKFCKNSFLSLEPIQKLQHIHECKKTFVDIDKEKEKDLDSGPSSSSSSTNTRKYECLSCEQILYLSSIEILKHKRKCVPKKEIKKEKI